MTLDVLAIFASPPLPLAVGLGLACVGILYALHHLRAQPPRRPTATLLFWQQAIRSSQTRVPWSRRFTHLRTFILLASILLLWAASLAADQWNNAATAPRDIIVIDAGQETAAQSTVDVFNRTLLRDLADAATINLSRLTGNLGLMVAGPQPILLVKPEEPAAVTARVLAALTPQNGASASSLALQAAGLVLGEKPGRIVWFTPADALPAGLPGELRHRIILHQVRPASADVITGITFTPAPDGSPQGNLRVHIAGTPDDAMMLQAQTLARDATPAMTMTRRAAEFTDGTAVFENWPADGRTVTLTLLKAPGAPTSHKIEYRVPDRRPPIFHFGDDVPKGLRLALLTVGKDATQNKSASNVIFVASQGTSIPPDAVARILIDSNGTGVTYGTPLHLGDTPLVNGLSLEGAVAAEGPALSSTGTGVLSAGPASVMSLNLSNDPPTLTLSSAVNNSTADLPRRAAFPVLLGRLCEVLINRVDATLVISPLRSATDPLWTGPWNAPASETKTIADHPPSTVAVAVPQSLENARWTMRWSDMLLAAAVILLMVESMLYAMRRIV